MTYPPQGPYGPGTGGFPQQGGYPQPGGYPPPKKSNTGLIVTVVGLVVVLLAALGVTGFWQPGFFLSDDETSEASGGGSTETSGPQALAQQIVAGLNAKDTAKLGGLKCASADQDVDQVIQGVQQLQSASLAGEVKTISDTQASADVAVITSDGNTINAAGLMAKEGEKWCWQDVNIGGNVPGQTDGPAPGPDTQQAPPVPNPAPGPGGGGGTSVTQVFDTFINAVNSGDASAAKQLACPSFASDSNVQEAISKRAVVRMEERPDESVKYAQGVSLTGTVDGEPAHGGRISGRSEGEGQPWCVQYFSIY